MKNLYNKGKYRSFEYAKHLRPFLKRIGNKKFRKTEKQEIESQLNDFVGFQKVRKKRQFKIWVKITTEDSIRKYSEYKNFYSEKSFQDSIKRNAVTHFFIINNKKHDIKNSRKTKRS
ncbi:hypothetical protein [Chryseobacterium salviniae]|uniref:Uncharacterized protein n=1 Tax=Chryseobacterium salviniae TaxID=3101750 RepID=A0ABU6HRT1_9FLAO|nr:hypothetical protein [Chryseobacterium sp. T9W2-O]MEC3875608.1 hypothetical protein [Chryseobacterium sp. T9W2-O]